VHGGKSTYFPALEYRLDNVYAEDYSFAWDDVISSVKVDAGEKWELFTGNGYAGRSKVVSGDVRFVGNDFNDQISSLRKVTVHNPSKGIILYQHPKYHGPFLKLSKGDDWLPSSMNDKATSVKVAPGEKWELFTDPHYKGDRKLVSGNVPELHKSDRRMNDKISSVRKIGTGITVYEHGYYKGASRVFNKDVPELGCSARIRLVLDHVDYCPHRCGDLR